MATTPIHFSHHRTNRSDHPEAVLKRQSRRKHNYAARQYLQSSDPYTSPLERSNNAHPRLLDASAVSPAGVHELHSNNIQRLDANTTAEEVVRAIKRAQNLHDLHDVAEIAHFLVEEVGEKELHGCTQTRPYCCEIVCVSYLFSVLCTDRPVLRLWIQRLPALTFGRGISPSQQCANRYAVHRRATYSPPIVHAAARVCRHYTRIDSMSLRSRGLGGIGG